LAGTVGPPAFKLVGGPAVAVAFSWGFAPETVKMC